MFITHELGLHIHKLVWRGKNHSGICRENSAGCFKCGLTKNLMKQCPKSKQCSGNGGNRAQSSSVAPQGNTTFRGGTSGVSGGTNRLYILNSHQEQENSSDVVTGMIQVFEFPVYALLDP